MNKSGFPHPSAKNLKMILLLAQVVIARRIIKQNEWWIRKNRNPKRAKEKDLTKRVKSMIIMTQEHRRRLLPYNRQK